MSILKDVLAELFGMFVADIWLSTAILAVVALSGAAIHLDAGPLLSGGLLLVGCLGVTIGSVVLYARRKKDQYAEVLNKAR